MGYSDNEAMVRVDFFKKSGKWYATEAIEMASKDWSSVSTADALKGALNERLYRPEEDRMQYSGMRAVCLEPYHKHAAPLMLDIPDEGNFELDEFEHKKPRMNWAEDYQLSQQVEVRVCESPEEWESFKVGGIGANTGVLVTNGNDRLFITNPKEIRPER